MKGSEQELKRSISALKVAAKCIAAGMDEEIIDSDEVLALLNTIAKQQERMLKVFLDKSKQQAANDVAIIKQQQSN